MKPFRHFRNHWGLNWNWENGFTSSDQECFASDKHVFSGGGETTRWVVKNSFMLSTRRIPLPCYILLLLLFARSFHSNKKKKECAMRELWIEINIPRTHCVDMFDNFSTQIACTKTLFWSFLILSTPEKASTFTQRWMVNMMNTILWIFDSIPTSPVAPVALCSCYSRILNLFGIPVMLVPSTSRSNLIQIKWNLN